MDYRTAIYLGDMKMHNDKLFLNGVMVKVGWKGNFTSIITWAKASFKVKEIVDTEGATHIILE